VKELLRRFSDEDIVRSYDGATSHDDFFHEYNGKEWIEASYLCLLMGVKNERHLLEDKLVWPEMNLTDDETFILNLSGYERDAMWCVSETGFWKIVARSNSLWARKLRASFLPM